MTTEQKMTMEIQGGTLMLTTMDRASVEAVELRQKICGLILKRSKMTIGELAEEASE